jgi:hypothetical protein
MGGDCKIGVRVKFVCVLVLGRLVNADGVGLVGAASL